MPTNPPTPDDKTLIAALARAVVLLEGYGSITTNGEGIDLAARLAVYGRRLESELTSRRAALDASVAKGYLRRDHGEGEAQARAVEALEIINAGPLVTP